MYMFRAQRIASDIVSIQSCGACICHYGTCCRPNACYDPGYFPKLLNCNPLCCHDCSRVLVLALVCSCFAVRLMEAYMLSLHGSDVDATQPATMAEVSAMGCIPLRPSGPWWATRGGQDNS